MMGKSSGFEHACCTVSANKKLFKRSKTTEKQKKEKTSAKTQNLPFSKRICINTVLFFISVACESEEIGKQNLIWWRQREHFPIY